MEKYLFSVTRTEVLYFSVEGENHAHAKTKMERYACTYECEAESREWGIERKEVKYHGLCTTKPSGEANAYGIARAY